MRIYTAAIIVLLTVAGMPVSAVACADSFRYKTLIGKTIGDEHVYVTVNAFSNLAMCQRAADMLSIRKSPADCDANYCLTPVWCVEMHCADAPLSAIDQRALDAKTATVKRMPR